MLTLHLKQLFFTRAAFLMMTNNTQTLINRLKTLEAAVVADVMVAMGLECQVLAPSFLSLGLNEQLIGPAICAKGRVDAGDDAKPTFGLDDSVYPGGVVVIDSNSCQKGALIGDNMATSMKNNGAIGFIVDGGIRDAVEFLTLELPIFYKYKTPINAHKFFSFTDFEVPISLDGVWGNVIVNPGDLIIADSDGCSIIPLQHAEQIITDSEIHQQTENTIKNALENGESRKNASAKSPRLQHVKKCV